MATTTIKIEHKDGKTIVSNNKGDVWDFNGRLDDTTAIASIVFFTLQAQFDKMSFWANNYEIRFAMECEEKDDKLED